MEPLQITYLLNSGFLVRRGRWAVVFDDYLDPAGAVDAALPQVDELYIFATHAHFDHFNVDIKKYAAAATQYFLSSDIRHTKRVRELPADKIHFLKTYDAYEDDSIKITSFDSTDTGTSFLIEKDGWRIFHAGDFNWWHWAEDTEENIKFARNGFMKQMKRLDGMEADVAFFPVDGRLGEARDWGAKEFCRRTNVKALVTMHSVGYPRWKPGKDFFAPEHRIPVWSPAQPGETRTLLLGGQFQSEAGAAKR